MTQRVHQLAVHFSHSPMTQWQNIALEAGSTWIPRHPSSHIDLLQHKRTQKVSLSKRKWKYFKGGLQMTLPRGSITHALLVALLSVGGSGNARIALMLGRAVISMARSEEELYLKAFRSLSGEIDAGRLWESKRWHWPTLFGHTARQGRQQGKRRSRREERGREKGQFPSSFSLSLSLPLLSECTPAPGLPTWGRKIGGFAPRPPPPSPLLLVPHTSFVSGRGEFLRKLITSWKPWRVGAPLGVKWEGKSEGSGVRAPVMKSRRDTRRTQREKEGIVEQAEDERGRKWPQKREQGAGENKQRAGEGREHRRRKWRQKERRKWNQGIGNTAKPLEENVKIKGL